MIGAGIVGLTAAYHLARAGHSVTVVEREQYAGGQLRTVSVGDSRVEGFYHHMFRGDRALLGLIRELGLSHHLGWYPSRVGQVVSAPEYPFGRTFPLSTPLDLLRFSPLPLPDRLRAAATLTALQARKDGASLVGVTAADWLRRHLGQRGYRVLFEPLLRGKFGPCAERVSMAWVWDRLRVRLGSRPHPLARERLGYMRGSFYRIVEALSRKIGQYGGRILTGAGQVTLDLAGDGAVARVVCSSGWVRICDVDAVLAAVPSAALADILERSGYCDADYTAGLRSVPHRPAVCFMSVLSPQAARMFPYYWVNDIPLGSPRSHLRKYHPVVQVHHTALVPQSWYGGRTIVYRGFYPDEDAVHAVAARTGHDPCYHTCVERHAQPVPTCDYPRIMPGMSTPVRGLYLANGDLIFPGDRGMNNSVELARRAAELIMRGGA